MVRTAWAVATGWAPSARGGRMLRKVQTSVSRVMRGSAHRDWK